MPRSNPIDRRAISEHLFRRGQHAPLYLRSRNPTPLLDAFTLGKWEFLVCPRTSDVKGVAAARRFAQARLLFERTGKYLEQSWPKRGVVSSTS